MSFHGMARYWASELLKQGLCWLGLRQVSVFSKNKDISNTNTGNNKNGFILQLEFGKYIRDPTWRFLGPFPFLLRQRLLCPGKQSNQNWAKEAMRNFVENLVYPVFSGNDSSTYYRDCIIFILREPTDFFNCMAWSLCEKELQNIFHQNDVTAIEQNCIFPQERESKTVLDSRFQLLHSSLCKWNLISRLQSFGILDSLSFISDFKTKDFGFLKLLLPDSIFHKQALPTVQVLWMPLGFCCVVACS